MPGRFFLRALAALFIYCCVIGMFHWSPGLSGRIKPHLYATLTESIDFVRVKAVITDLFSYSRGPQTGYSETLYMKDRAEPINEERGKAERPMR